MQTYFTDTAKIYANHEYYKQTNVFWLPLTIVTRWLKYRDFCLFLIDYFILIGQFLCLSIWTLLSFIHRNLFLKVFPPPWQSLWQSFILSVTGNKIETLVAEKTNPALSLHHLIQTTLSSLLFLTVSFASDFTENQCVMKNSPIGHFKFIPFPMTWVLFFFGKKMQSEPNPHDYFCA